MTWKGIDIIDQLHLPRARCRTTNPTIKGDLQTPVPPLIGTNFQQIGGRDAVQPCPVKTVIAVMHFACESRHQGHLIRFPITHRQDTLAQFCIINDHGYSRSNAMAVPSPPPIQIAATPRLTSRRSIALSNVTIIRAPEAPIGCPKAQAPP